MINRPTLCSNVQLLSRDARMKMSLFDAVFSYIGRCCSFIGDTMVLYGFDWRRNSAYSATLTGIVWLVVLFIEISIIQKGVTLFLVFACSMLLAAALTLYRFHKDKRDPAVRR